MCYVPVVTEVRVSMLRGGGLDGCSEEVQSEVVSPSHSRGGGYRFCFNAETKHFEALRFCRGKSVLLKKTYQCMLCCC
jgi:hypothetical protein